ncbi:MAG TPA: P1 family peptidase, partial [Myxococcaceae bacterium]|nr:P1 family peptidase [Myxococcaceae bacterium]
IAGVPAGQEIPVQAPGRDEDQESGSIIIVVATDAPLTHRNLRRLAERAVMGLGRTGSFASNGSGDYVIAFSTAPSVRRAYSAERLSVEELGNDAMSPLFAAVVEATEEAIYNSLFMATTVRGNGQTVEAIPLDRVREVLRRHGVGVEAGPEGTRLE